MRHDTPKLTDQQVLLHARSRLQAHLPLHADAYRCTTHDLLQVLLGVAVNHGTIEASAPTCWMRLIPPPSVATSMPNCVWRSCRSWSSG